MKKSEKLLAAAVGIVLLASAITFGFLDFFSQFKNNKTQLQGLEKRISDEEFKLLLALEGGDRLGLFYEAISFPADKREITAYQDWLEKTVRGSGLRIAQIGDPSENRLTFTTDNRTVQSIGKKYDINVTSYGTLDEVIEFCIPYRYQV